MVYKKATIVFFMIFHKWVGRYRPLENDLVKIYLKIYNIYNQYDVVLKYFRYITYGMLYALIPSSAR